MKHHFPILSQGVMQFLLPNTVFGRVTWLAISIATSWWLLSGHLNYPLHLLAAHLAVVLLCQTLCSLERIRTLIQAPGSLGSLDISALLFMGLAVPLLVSWYKALALSGNVTSLLMILSLDWRPSQLFEKIFKQELGYRDLIRYSIFCAGLLAIYAFDYRLRAVPRNMSLAFLGIIGVAEVVGQWQLVLSKPHLRPRSIADKPAWQTGYWPSFAFVLVTIMAIRTEYLRGEPYIPAYPTATAAIVNVLTTALAVVSIMSDSRAVPLEGNQLGDLAECAPVVNSAVRPLLGGLVSVISSIIAGKPVVLSLWQCGGFVMALFAFTTADEVKSAFQRAPAARFTGHQPTATYFPSKVSDLLILAGACWLCTGFIAFGQAPPAPDYQTLSLGPSPTPSPAKIDVVVARYAEPATSVVHDLNSLLATPKLQGMVSRIVIYNKNTDVDDFQRDVSASISHKSQVEFRSLDNVGCEGDTYLHHIVSEWDSLSKHVLFVQAEPHDLALAKHYIQTFFVSETGFLSLSYEGVVCERCEHCHDVEWHEDSETLADLYSSANAGRPCQNLVLTYRGQFIVSAARIRGNNVTLYEDLLRQLRDPDSRIHSAAYTKSIWHWDHIDSLQSPAFGYTLERMWGVLMQCSDLRIGHWSPSQLAVWARPTWLVGEFPVDSAQCLDQPLEGVEDYVA